MENTNENNIRSMQNTEDQEISISQLLNIIMLKKIWLILFFIVAVAAAFGYLKVVNPSYESTASAMVSPISNATSFESLLSSSTSNKIDTEVQLITSKTNLQNALDLLDLDSYLDPDGIPYSDPEKNLRNSKLSSKVSVSTVSNTTVVKLTVTDGNPQFCADYANAILESYTKMLTGIAKNSKSAQREFIEAQIPVTEALLEEASLALSNYKEQSGITQISEKSSLLAKKSASFQLMVEPLNLQLVESESLMGALNVDGQYPTAEQIGSDASVKALVSEYIANTRELLMYRSMDNSAESTRTFVLENTLSSKEKEILDRVSSVVGASQSYAKAVADYLCVNANIQAISIVVDEFNQELSQFPVLERELMGYERDVQIYESLLLSLRQMLEETKMVEAAVVGNVTVIDSASVPVNPVSPRKMMILAVAAVGGIALGVMFAFLLEFMDNTIRDEDVIKRILGRDVPGLGWTPYVRQVSRMKFDYPALFVHNDPDGHISERFRAIANNIVYCVPDKVQVMSINSTDMNEGKTTIICNIAAVHAMNGKKVVIIDGDFRKPALEVFFKLKRSKVGLSDAIMDNVPLEKCIVRPVDQLPNLHMIPVGRGTRNPNALFDSPKFAAIIEKLKKVYDYVIIDCPPLLYGSEFTHLAPHLDGFVLNIRAGISTKNNLSSFASELQFLKAPMLGYIFYGVVAKNQGSYGYNGYGYSYSSSYGSKKYGYGYGDSKHVHYKEGRGSYRKIFKAELKNRAKAKYGENEPVLAFRNGVANAFTAKDPAVKEELPEARSYDDVRPVRDDGITDQKTSDMLADIEKTFS